MGATYYCVVFDIRNGKILFEGNTNDSFEASGWLVGTRGVGYPNPDGSERRTNRERKVITPTDGNVYSYVFNHSEGEYDYIVAVVYWK
jgi:hypothetical protein